MVIYNCLIVIYTSDVQSAEAALKTDCFTLRTEQAFLSHIDGEATFREIQGRLQSGILLADDDLMRLVILPLTVPGTEGKQDMLERIVDPGLGYVSLRISYFYKWPSFQNTGRKVHHLAGVYGSSFPHYTCPAGYGCQGRLLPLHTSDIPPGLYSPFR